MFKHQDLQISVFFTHLAAVVGCGSETQLQAGENLMFIYNVVQFNLTRHFCINHGDRRFFFNLKSS